MIKRLFDLLVSISILMLFGPLLLALSVWVLALAGRPALYRGWRAGRNGMPFRIIKLRTMTPDAERQGGAETPSDDPRIIGIGKLLRRYKLDELPQFWNVMAGHMSIVGPRPEVIEEVRQYGILDRKLVSLRPGITDWASVKFRYEDEMLRGKGDPHVAYHKLIQPDKKRLGLEYQSHHSMSVDLAIIWSTLLSIFKRYA